NAFQVAEPESLSATIGAEGGAIEAPDTSILRGVKLVVPAGALSEPAEIAIRETIDPTPLPELAMRVGPHVAIESSAELAGPSTLTLPVDQDLVERFGQSASDVKVWVRESDGWSLRDAIDTSSTSVTIELRGQTIAAAGVRLSSVSLSCGAVSCASLAAPVA